MQQSLFEITTQAIESDQGAFLKPIVFTTKIRKFLYRKNEDGINNTTFTKCLFFNLKAKES